MIKLSIPVVDTIKKTKYCFNLMKKFQLTLNIKIK